MGKEVCKICFLCVLENVRIFAIFCADEKAAISFKVRGLFINDVDIY